MFRSMPISGLPSNFVQNDGSDWSLGTPSVLIPGWGVHDAWLDLDGQLWFTCNIPNRRTTIGKIDTKTGEVKLFKLAGSQRSRGANPWHDPRCQRHHLVQRQYWTRRSGSPRSQDREDRRLPAAAGHVADRRRDHGGSRRQRPDLGIRTGRRLALRSRARRRSPSSSRSPTRPRTVPASPMARPPTATATAGGRR